jgi:hypothetical protein
MEEINTMKPHVLKIHFFINIKSVSLGFLIYTIAHILSLNPRPPNSHFIYIYIYIYIRRTFILYEESVGDANPNGI